MSLINKKINKDFWNRTIPCWLRIEFSSNHAKGKNGTKKAKNGTVWIKLVTTLFSRSRVFECDDFLLIITERPFLEIDCEHLESSDETECSISIFAYVHKKEHAKIFSPKNTVLNVRFLKNFSWPKKLPL